MNQTYEIHLQPERFGPLYDGDRRTLTLEATTPVSPGQHLVVQEYCGREFTGRWIRCRVTDVETQPSDCCLSVLLQQIARSRMPTLRRRAA